MWEVASDFLHDLLLSSYNLAAIWQKTDMDGRE